MLEAINKIQDFIKTLDFDRFVKDLAIHDAVMYNFIVIGEASVRISPEFKNSNPSIEWHKLKGMRNHLAHSYDEIDYNVIWDTATRHLDDLKSELEIILNNNQGNSKN